MNDEFLYQQIADSLRQEIQSGKLKPGDRILSVREMTRQWNCTPGTVQRAYQELSRQGLVTSRPGQGTRVSESITAGKHGALEKAALVNRVEKSLLEFITAGYSPVDLEFAFQTALERWKAIEQQPASMSDNAIIFYGSHDPAVNWLSNQFSIKHPAYSIVTSYIGSLGGLIALAQGKALLTGSHLWDPDTGDYNIPYLRKLIPGQTVMRLTLAERKLGLVLPAGNPLSLHTLTDLPKPGIEMINRQAGSGTRVWLDEQLKLLKIDHQKINGYQHECLTHSEAARAVAQGQANVALALEAAAIAFKLDFIPLTLERYDLFFTERNKNHPALRLLVEMLQMPETKSGINSFGGYATNLTGETTAIEL